MVNVNNRNDGVQHYRWNPTDDVAETIHIQISEYFQWLIELGVDGTELYVANLPNCLVWSVEELMECEITKVLYEDKDAQVYIATIFDIDDCCISHTFASTNLAVLYNRISNIFCKRCESWYNLHDQIQEIIDESEAQEIEMIEAKESQIYPDTDLFG